MEGLTFNSGGVCVPTSCEAGLYLGDTGCLECPLCELCEEDAMCHDCGCVDSTEASPDGTEGGTDDTAGSGSTASAKEERHETAVFESGTSVGSSFVMIGALMTGSPNLFASLFITVELFSYLPLININLTSHQTDLLVGANQVNNLPDYFSGLECSPPQHPRRNYDFDCSNFLKIAQKELTILSGLGLISLVSWIVACAAKVCLSNFSKVLKKVLPLTRKLLLIVLIDSLIKAAYSAQVSGIDSAEEAFGWCMVVVVWQLYLLIGGVGGFAAFRPFSCYPNCMHFLFNDLNPNIRSRLHFSLLILHRMAYAAVIIGLDAPKVQLLCLSSFTAAVSPSQFTIYLIIVRPYQDIRDTILHLGTHCVVTGFCIFLTLNQYKAFGDDQQLVSTGIIWSIMSIIFLHVVAVAAKIASVVQEILESQNAEPPLKLAIIS
jgi:hypothetical protein